MSESTIKVEDVDPTSVPIPSSLTTPLSAPSLERSTSQQSRTATSINAEIYGIALVGFDHQLGPTVEFLHPSHLSSNQQLYNALPFLALPDGAHARDEDYTYFHLHLDSIQPDETIFGISCNRQIKATELLNKSSDITRSTVQKAIVVLASKPIFGPLRNKLGVVTRSYFAQRDFKDKSILVDLYSSFTAATNDTTTTMTENNEKENDEEQRGEDLEEIQLTTGETEVKEEGNEEGLKESEETRRQKTENVPPQSQPSEGRGRLYPPPPPFPISTEEEVGLSEAEEAEIYMGTFLRELVHKFRFKTLMLLKLLMLQRRVMFFSTTTPVEQLCTFQYSLVALIPALLPSLQDSASPLLSNRLQNLRRPTSLKTSDKGSLIRYLGLPLEIFGQGSFFQPYLPLEQIELLQRSKSYLVGTTNSIIQQQRDCNIDVVVNLDTTSLTILNPALTPLITLTPADRKWMDELVTTVDQSWNDLDPERPKGMGWVGSEDFLRGKFEEYVCSLLACVKFGDFLENGAARADMLLSAPELESYNPSSFNEGFIKAFKQTRAFEVWDRNTDEVIFDLVEPKHPMEGKTNPFEDVGIRLVSGLHDLHLPENLGPTREAIQRGLVSGTEGIWGAVKWAREEAGKRQRELQGAGQSNTTTLGGGNQGGNDGFEGGGGGGNEGTGEKVGSNSSGTKDREKDKVGETFLAGVDVAKTGAATVAAGLGSFWGKARNSTLFAANSNPVQTTTKPTSSSTSELNVPSSSFSSSTTSPIPPRAPSPTPSTISTTSSNKSSSLVTVNAGVITTPPTNSHSTFSSPSTNSTPGGSFLKPLSTAVAATPAAPSSTSPGSSQGSTPTTNGTSGFSSFFGGIRRSFIEQPQPTPSSSSTTTSQSTPPSTATSTSNGLNLPSLGSFGWSTTRPASTAATRRTSTSPTMPSNPSLTPPTATSNWRSSSSNASTRRTTPSAPPSSESIPMLSSTSHATSNGVEDEEEEEGIATFVIRDLDQERALKEERERVEREEERKKVKEREEAMRKLEGGGD